MNIDLQIDKVRVEIVEKLWNKAHTTLRDKVERQVWQQVELQVWTPVDLQTWVKVGSRASDINSS